MIKGLLSRYRPNITELFPIIGQPAPHEYIEIRGVNPQSYNSSFQSKLVSTCSIKVMDSLLYYPGHPMFFNVAHKKSTNSSESNNIMRSL